MAFPPIPTKKLKAFASKKTEDPIKKLTKGAPSKGDDGDAGDDEDDDKGSESGVDIKKAMEGAAAHDDDEIEEVMSGYDPEIDKNPPTFVTDSDTWNNAKKELAPKWNDLEEPYLVQAYVYKALGGKFEDKK